MRTQHLITTVVYLASYVYDTTRIDFYMFFALACSSNLAVAGHRGGHVMREKPMNVGWMSPGHSTSTGGVSHLGVLSEADTNVCAHLCFTSQS